MTGKLIKIICLPIAIVRFIVFALYSVIYLYYLQILFLLKHGKNPDISKHSKLWALVSAWILGIKMEISNPGNLPENSIFMSNHRTYLDILICFAIYPASIIAKKELGSWPLVSTAVRFLKIILVDRSNMASLIETMRKAEEHLVGGGRLIVYPEGTTGNENGTKAFKSGIFAIAVQNQIKTIPVVIEFKHRDMAWVDDDLFLPHFLMTLGRPVNRVKIIIGEPLCGNDEKELRITIKNWMDKQLAEIQASWN